MSTSLCEGKTVRFPGRWHLITAFWYATTHAVVILLKRPRLRWLLFVGSWGEPRGEGVKEAAGDPTAAHPPQGPLLQTWWPQSMGQSWVSLWACFALVLVLEGSVLTGFW